MKVVGLLSGGKDSCYNLAHCVRQGHEIVALATLAPPQGKDEIDSYMYQTVGHDAVHLVAEAMQLPLYRREIRGTAVNRGVRYGRRLPGHGSPTDGSGEDETGGVDETEDLYELLRHVKCQHADVEAVSVGAILSNYQRVRVEHVALRAELALLPLAFLWRRGQAQLLREMVDAGLEAVLIKVAGIGLDERCLGKTLAQMQSKLGLLHQRYGAHVCGEGGEYETLTVDSPLHRKRIVLDEVETCIHSDSAFASVAYLRIKRAHLEEKQARVDDAIAASVARVFVPAPLDSLGEATRRAAMAEMATTSGSAASEWGVDTKDADRSADARESLVSPSDILHESPTFASQDTLFAVTGVQSAPGHEDTAICFDELFAALQAQLHARNLSLADVSHLDVYLRTQADFGALNAAYARRFGAEPPSRACVAVGSRAPGDGSTQEGAHAPRAALVAIGDTRAARGDAGQRRVVHVQSRSYWAAANIGPYSQAVVADSRITIAGQIGLRPADLSLDTTDEAGQMALGLQHARRVLQAAAPSARAEAGAEEGCLSTGMALGCICWLEKAGVGRSNRLDMARAAWRAQWRDTDDRLGVGAEDADNADDASPEPSLDLEYDWLHGEGASRPQLPILYATLPPASLPRGAVAEWQLLAHDGRRREDADGESEGTEGGSDDGDEVSPQAARAVSRGTWRGWNWSASRVGTRLKPSSFGLATRACDARGEESSASAEATASGSPVGLDQAVLVRILWDVGTGQRALAQARDLLRRCGCQAAVSAVPVQRLHDLDGLCVDVAVVWQGT